MGVEAVNTDNPQLPTWSGLAKGDTGAGWMLPPYRTAFFQATGTPGADFSVQLEGSNDGENWSKLSPAALTAVGVFAALANNEYPKYIRPNVTAGDDTTDVTIIGQALINQ